MKFTLAAKSVYNFVRNFIAPIWLTRLFHYIINTYKTHMLERELNISKDVSQRLSLLLKRIVAGSDDVYITPMAESLGPDEFLSGWDDIYNSNISRVNSVLAKMEHENRLKYGPRSIALPWKERKEQVYTYYNSDVSKEFAYKPALFGRLRPISLNKAVEYLKNGSNSGLPFMVKKGNIKDTVLADFESLLKREDPCIMFTRTQENSKTRTVWGMPVADTLNEMRYYRPLLDYQKTLPNRAAVVGPEQVDEGVTKCMVYARNLGLDLVSIDFKSYDASVRGKLIDSAFTYISYLFQPNCKDDLDYIKQRFKTIGLLTPDGVLKGEHGVPSGSTFTNEVDSIVQYGIASEFEEHLPFSQQQGDDGLYACSDGHKLIDHFKSYGLLVSDYPKTEIAKDHCVYLQNLYHFDYMVNGKIGGIYPTYRALMRLAYQERFDEFKDDISGKDYYSIRALSILENCKHHPLFKELVEYVVKCDKYQLHPSDQGIAQFVKMKAMQDGKDINFNIHSYGDKIRGIKNFESYKIMKQMYNSSVEHT